MSKKVNFKFPRYRFLIIRPLFTLFNLGILLSLFLKETDLRNSLVYANSVGYGVAYLSLLVVSQVLYYATCLTNPGFVPSHLGEDDECAASLLSGVTNRVCKECQIDQPMRSHHCEDCNKCVRRFDHHCPCFDKCIGEHNHRWYWLFLLVTAPLIWWSCFILWNAIQPRLTWSEWFSFNAVYVIEIVVLLTLGVAVTGLLAFHTYFIGQGTTTWEIMSRERITYLKKLHDDYNPFDEGIARNILNFFFWCRTRQWQVLYRKVVGPTEQGP